jgi:hypothetical protein
MSPTSSPSSSAKSKGYDYTPTHLLFSTEGGDKFEGIPCMLLPSVPSKSKSGAMVTLAFGDPGDSSVPPILRRKLKSIRLEPIVETKANSQADAISNLSAADDTEGASAAATPATKPPAANVVSVRKYIFGDFSDDDFDEKLDVVVAASATGAKEEAKKAKVKVVPSLTVLENIIEPRQPVDDAELSMPAVTVNAPVDALSATRRSSGARDQKKSHAPSVVNRTYGPHEFNPDAAKDYLLEAMRRFLKEFAEGKQTNVVFFS